MSITKNFTSLGLLTLFSRILGFVRDILLASVLGTNNNSDVFLIAFKLPNLFRRFIGEGIINAAVVPYISNTLKKEGKNQAIAIIRQIFSYQIAIVVPLTILCIVFMPFLVKLQFYGLSQEKFESTVTLSRYIFPYLPCITISVFMASILTIWGRFSVLAFLQIILNMMMICTLLFFFISKISASPLALAMTVTLSGILQILWATYKCHQYGFPIAINFKKKLQDLDGFFPTALSIISIEFINYLSIITGDWFASFMKDGTISYLYYADRVNQLPLALIGTSLAIVLLPSITNSTNQKEKEMYVDEAIKIAAFLSIPAAIGLFLVPDLIVHILFERYLFQEEARYATASLLKIYAFGIPACVFLKVQYQIFFSKKQSKILLPNTIICLIFYVLLCTFLTPHYSFLGIALASICSNWIYMGLNSFLLRKEGYVLFHKHICIFLWNVIKSCIPLVVFLYFSLILPKESLLKIPHHKWMIAMILTLSLPIYFYSGFKICKINWRDFIKKKKNDNERII